LERVERREASQIDYAIIYAAGTQTTDEVTFAEPGDMILLGARAMEGLNLRVDPRLKRLVDAGPIDAGPIDAGLCSSAA
jgi:predicted aspartyl protease